MKLILASASPRREKLLRGAGFEFEIAPADIEEKADPSLPPAQIAMNLASEKAKTVEKTAPEGSVILAADTIVVLDDVIYGKPLDKDEAMKTLRRLSGRVHKVYTGVSILHEGKETVFNRSADVKFRELTDNIILQYIATGEPFGKAGAYAVQGEGASLVERVTGDITTVIGLPMEAVALELKKFS
ncbi:MAG: Maf family protein [Oscillospiraceae bacterium]|nr:Maf family protein [Oscillospiraceae bacterium]